MAPFSQPVVYTSKLKKNREKWSSLILGPSELSDLSYLQNISKRWAWNRIRGIDLNVSSKLPIPSHLEHSNSNPTHHNYPNAPRMNTHYHYHHHYHNPNPSKIFTNQDAVHLAKDRTSCLIPARYTSIEANCFNNWNHDFDLLTVITIPVGVKEVGENAFRNAAVEVLDFSKNGSLAIGDAAFWECKSATS